MSTHNTGTDTATHSAEHVGPDARETTDWHRHVVAEEGVPQTEHTSQVNPAALLFTLGATFGFVIVFVLIVAVYYNAYLTNERVALVEQWEPISKEYFEYRAQSEAELSNADWIADGQAVRVPIDVAKEKVVERYQSAGSAGGPAAVLDPVAPDADPAGDRRGE